MKYPDIRSRKEQRRKAQRHMKWLSAREWQERRAGNEESARALQTEGTALVRRS